MVNAHDPFRIDGPACVSFSGGRSSAYLLWRILLAHDGTLPPDVVVLFANTGKEREETLEFVRDCGQRWGVRVVWLEFLARAAAGFQVVDFEDAAREGEPFDRLIEQKARLPNPIERACTEELKINTMARWLAANNLADADMAVGVRADESHRVPKMRARGRLLPLVDASIGKQAVWAFWKSHPFDLALPFQDGHSNCDLCFLKSADQVLSRIREEPARAIWWIEKEKRRGATFRSDRPSYAAMHDFAIHQATCSTTAVRRCHAFAATERPMPSTGNGQFEKRVRRA